MSDASNVDDNNNDGTSACRVTSFNNCCDSTRSPLHPSISANKDPHQTDSSKEEAHSLPTSLQASGNHLSTSAEFLNDKEKCEHELNIQKYLSLKRQISHNKDSDESSSEKENKLNGDFLEAKSKPITIFQKASPRGILKYPPGWRRRAISESSTMIYSSSSISDDYSFYGTSLDSPDIIFEFEDDCIEDGQDKPKKNVTFSDKMATFLFRPNSSILGRRLKNQKKAKKKKEKKLLDSLENLNSDNGVEFKDEVEAAKHFITMQRMPLDSYDSSTDASSSSGCDCSSTDCSGDEAAPVEELNKYEGESKSDSSKSKRNNRRKRNRRNKQSLRTNLETGGYDSE